jgi:hypothetical protein
MQGMYCRSKKDLLDSKKKATIEKKRPTVEKSYLVCCALKCFLRSGKYWGKFIFVTGAPASMAMQSAARAACSARNSQTGSALR